MHLCANDNGPKKNYSLIVGIVIAISIMIQFQDIFNECTIPNPSVDLGDGLASFLRVIGRVSFLRNPQSMPAVQ